MADSFTEQQGQQQAEQLAWMRKLGTLLKAPERKLVKDRLEQHLVATGRVRAPGGTEAERAAREDMVQNLVADRSEIGANVSYAEGHAAASQRSREEATRLHNAAALDTQTKLALKNAETPNTDAWHKATFDHDRAKKVEEKALDSKTKILAATGTGLALRTGAAQNGANDRVNRLRAAVPLDKPLQRQVAQKALIDAGSTLTGQALSDAVDQSLKDGAEASFYKQIAQPLLDREMPAGTLHSAADLKTRAMERLVDIEVEQIVSARIEARIAAEVDQLDANGVSLRIVHPMQRVQEIEAIVHGVAAAYGFTNLAHFISRHGAERKNPDAGVSTLNPLAAGHAPTLASNEVTKPETTRTHHDAASRVVTGVAPDKAHGNALPQEQLTTVGVTDIHGVAQPDETVNVPHYPNRGQQIAQASSQHASAKAALYMMEEAAAQAARAQAENPGAAGHTLNVYTGKEGVGGTQLGSFPEKDGLGASYAVNEAGMTNAQKLKNNPTTLALGTIQTRLAALSKTVGATSSKSVLIPDVLHGGFTPMTMFTQSAVVGADVRDDTVDDEVFEAAQTAAMRVLAGGLLGNPAKQQAGAAAGRAAKALVPALDKTLNATARDAALADREAAQNTLCVTAQAEADKTGKAASDAATLREETGKTARTALDLALAHQPATVDKAAVREELVGLADAAAKADVARATTAAEATAAAARLKTAEDRTAEVAADAVRLITQTDAALHAAEAALIAATQAKDHILATIAGAGANVPLRLTEARAQAEAAETQKAIEAQQAMFAYSQAEVGKQLADANLAVQQARQLSEDKDALLRLAQKDVADAGVPVSKALTDALELATQALAASAQALSERRVEREKIRSDLAPMTAPGHPLARDEADEASLKASQARAAQTLADTQATQATGQLDTRLAQLTQGGDLALAGQAKAQIGTYASQAAAASSLQVAAGQAAGSLGKAQRNLADTQRARKVLASDEATVLAAEVADDAAVWALKGGENIEAYETRVKSHLKDLGLDKSATGEAATIDQLIDERATQLAAQAAASRERSADDLLGRNTRLASASQSRQDEQDALQAMKAQQDQRQQEQAIRVQQAKDKHVQLGQQAAQLQTTAEELAAKAVKASEDAKAAKALAKQRTRQPSAEAAQKIRAAQQAAERAAQNTLVLQQARQDGAALAQRSGPAAQAVTQAEQGLANARATPSADEAAARTQVVQLTTQIDAIDQAVTQLNQTLLQRRAQLDVLNPAMTQEATALDQLTTANPRDEAAIARSSKRMVDQLGQRTALESALNDLSTQMRQQRVQFDALRQQRATFEGQAQDARRAAIEAAQAGLSQQSLLAEDLQQKIQANAQSVQQIGDQLDALQLEFKGLDAAAKTFRDEEIRKAVEAAQAQALLSDQAGRVAQDAAQAHLQGAAQVLLAQSAITAEEAQAQTVEAQRSAALHTGAQAVKNAEATEAKAKKLQEETAKVNAQIEIELQAREKLDQANTARARQEVATHRAQAEAQAAPTDDVKKNAALQATHRLAITTARAAQAAAESERMDAELKRGTALTRLTNAQIAYDKAFALPDASRTELDKKLVAGWATVKPKLEAARDTAQAVWAPLDAAVTAAGVTLATALSEAQKVGVAG